jgi:hypothetical protein
MGRMKSAASAVAILGCFWSQAAIADTPVIDFTSIGNELRQIAQAEKGYALQAKQAFTEAQTYYTQAQMLLGFVHDPNLGAAMGLMNMAGLGNSLPVNPYAVQGLVNGFNYRAGGLPAFGGIAGSLSNLSNASWSTNHVFTPTDGSWRSKQVIASANGISGTQGAAEAAYQDYRSHAGVFQALRDRLATATTPKDVEDAHAQIALEQVWTNNQQGQLGAIEIAYLAQRDNNEQRDREQVMKAGQAYLDSAKAAGVIQ